MTIVDRVFTQEARDPVASKILRLGCLLATEKGKKAASDLSASSSSSFGGWSEQDAWEVDPQVEMYAALARHLAAAEVLGSGAPSNVVDVAAFQRAAWEAFSVDLGPCLAAGESSSRPACRPSCW